MRRESKVKVYRSMDRLHPEAGWKTITVRVEPRLVTRVISDSTSKSGYRLEKRWELE